MNAVITNALFLSFCEDCDHDHSPPKIPFLNHFSQRIAIMSRNPYKVYIEVKVKGRATSKVMEEG